MNYTISKETISRAIKALEEHTFNTYTDDDGQQEDTNNDEVIGIVEELKTIIDDRNRIDTMTVSQLIEHLQRYPAWLPVYAEWEGQWKSFKPESFHLVEVGDKKLMIDVER